MNQITLLPYQSLQSIDSTRRGLNANIRHERNWKQKNKTTETNVPPLIFRKRGQTTCTTAF